MTAIDVVSLSKQYGNVTALETVSFRIRSGEIYGLLGPNGAGKTTTIEILTGQTTPAAGTAAVLGVDVVEQPRAVRARVGILPEQESPPSLLTPREYLQFCGEVHDRSDDAVDERIGTWAERLGFADKLDILATDLSRGQQQKVMIAAAFLHEPELVFIDEPLANLDPIVQERVKAFLRSYRDAGNTVVLSTHNIDVAAALCTRVGILDAGELITEITPDALAPDTSLRDLFLEHVTDGIAHA